ncbi:MAG: LytTR family DNA-binding domain-containing protein [Eubacteriales bacterium]|nr:LytTR family DNA-binding domain-containing protein [Eubacteriales bacterium]
MIRVAIVEDNEKCQRSIHKFLEKYGKEYGEEFDITSYYDGIDIADEYIPQYDIILLDIQMKVMSGMDAAGIIRKRDPNVMIIFITNMPQFAIQGYDVDAKGFLVKPVYYVPFAKVITKALQVIKSNKKEYLVVEVKSRISRIDISEILYMECEGHYIHINLKNDEVLTVLLPMKEMEEKLSGKPFVRCNHGVLVNLNHVQSVDKNIIRVGKHELLISRPKKKGFMEALTKHMGGMNS